MTNVSIIVRDSQSSAIGLQCDVSRVLQHKTPQQHQNRLIQRCCHGNVLQQQHVTGVISDIHWAYN